MDLALHFPSPSLGYSLSRTAVNGDRRIRPQEKAFSSSSSSSSSSSNVRFKKGSIGCKKPSDEQTSYPSKSKQEEMISLLRRIQLSISKDESQGATEKKIGNGRTPENEPPLSKAILDVLEKPRKQTEDTGVKGTPKRQVKLAKRSPYRASTSSSIGKLPDKVLEEMKEKEEKPPLIETMKLAELKEVAKNRGIKGYSKLKKSELQKLLTSS